MEAYGMKHVLSYTCGTSQKPLFGMTIGDMFDETAVRHADNEALVVCHQNLRYTYRELQEAVNRCARGLMAMGLEKGDRIGICSPNAAEWAITQFATAKIGVILVNINPSYRVHELEYALNQSECEALVIAPRLKTSDYTRMIYDLAPELERAEPGKLRSKRLPALRTVLRLGEQAAPGMWNWQDLTAMADRVSEKSLADRQRGLQFDDPINIQYTSGTTGYPKGATLSHHNILNNGFFVAEMMKLTEKDRLVIPVPLYHCFGMVMGNIGCMTHGATMIYPCEVFDPEKVLDAVQAESATALYGVPTMFIAELAHPGFGKYELSSLRTGIMAGSPCPVEVMKKVGALMHMHEVEIAYGMTETSPVSFQTRHDAPFDKRVQTVGQVHPHIEVKIIDPVNNVVLPVGQVGELCTRGYSVMIGYWNNEAATREAIDATRWMHTGDLAVMDEDGYVNIVGRIKDMVIRGGENVYPREIEEFLYTHPQITDVQVIGVPDEKYGEALMAWVILRENENVTEDQLRDFCREKIARYKIPGYFKFVKEFPITVTGKVQKFVMRDQSIKELGLENVVKQKTA
jgi:fatty-acyl-CoA synthase